jgi:uncharacterized protein YutD
MQRFVSCGRRLCLLPIFIKDFMHIMEKVFYREVCLNGHRSSKKITQVLWKNSRTPVHIHDDNIERAQELTLWNRRVTLDNVTNHSQIGHGSAYAIVHDRFGFQKVCARWMSKKLIKKWRRRCIRGSQLRLKHFLMREYEFTKWTKCIQELGDYIKKWCMYFWQLLKINSSPTERVTFDSPS